MFDSFDLLVFLRRTVAFLQDFNGAITAAATVAIGVFTLVLVIVTRRQAMLTKQSVLISERALADLERAYIFIESIGGEFEPFVTMSLGSGAARFMIPDFSITFVNYGRTAGNIDLGIVRFEILKAIPPEIEVTEATSKDHRAQDAEIIIGPSNTYIIGKLGLEHAFEYEQGIAIREGRMAIYSHGFFVYRDIFNNGHTIKFCRRYDNRKEWIPEGGRERNQYT